MILRKYKFLIGFLLLSSFTTSAQSVDVKLDWIINKNVKANPEIKGKQLLRPFWCTTCKESISGNFIVPFFNYKIPLNNNVITDVKISNTQSVEITSAPAIPNVKNDYKIQFYKTVESGKSYTHITIIPLMKTKTGYNYLTSFTLNISTEQVTASSRLKRKKDQTYTSVLATNTFYKLKIASSGVYKLDANYLNSIGISPENMELNKVKIYGNGGIMLPELIDTDRNEDLTENAIRVYDENNNNKLDNNDYIAWYAQGPDEIAFDAQNNLYKALSHDFDENAYYFLTLEGESGKRIQAKPANSAIVPDYTINTYDYVIFHENDEENLIKSGRRWWGDKMQNNLTKTFNYSIPGIVKNKPSQFTSISGVRSLNSSYLSILVTGNEQSRINHGVVSGKYDDPFISGPVTRIFDYSLTSDNFSIEYEYHKSLTDASAWIDYFLFTPKRELAVFENQQSIRFHKENVSGNLKLQISNLSNDHEVWDVTELDKVEHQLTFNEGANSSFTIADAQSTQLPEFVLFNTTDIPNPEFVSVVQNQNLHGITQSEYLIITHRDLLDEANRLADFHRNNSNLEVHVVTNEQVFNEFSSGSQDVTAIRDFTKLIYDRGNASGKTLKYLLLFGDASYDYKDLSENNTNVVPIYQSYNSFDPPFSYCSDDYYAILDAGEGYWGINSVDEGLDIGVGRLPVSNTDEAKIVVDKILHYHSESSYGDWVQNLTFVGDDEDNNSHLGPSESMTQIIQNQNPEFNIKKIWLDAYEQVSFGSGNKYPKVNDEINNVINNKGTLIFNYVGHGGENGMAHERIVTRPEISSWSNQDKLSFYITASCELAKIDNLEIESPGELMLLNPNGGAIGMVATTRVVYIGYNTDLNFEIVNNNLFKVTDNKLQPLGIVYKNTRNAAFEVINKRCFLLLADPALRLHYPNYNVVTTKVNGTQVGLFNDTLKALSLVTIEGEIRDNNNTLLSNFNGTLHPTFYDKASTYKTLGNDPGSIPIEYSLQDRVIYKGKVSVTDGKFSYQFIVPKDIAYNVGKGKLSYYANDGVDHAGGTEVTYDIGGTSDEIVNDKTPPTLNLFIDDESWVFGGTTNSTPTLLATLFDENGINTIGSGIGREMEAILDKGTENEQSIILNDFYTPELNSFRAGKISYNFDNLSPGKHTLELKVWDVYNNSSEDYTEFEVMEQSDITISNLLNYPNPFNKFTTFHFDHNKAGQNITANLTIMSIAGNVVKSITQNIDNAPAHSSNIIWNGRDSYGDILARGVYLYTINVKAEDGSHQKKTQKLYIIN